MLHLDFETRSAAELPKVGVHVYAADPSTDILCAAYGFNDEPIQLLKRGEPLPSRFAEYILSGQEVWAHNAPFEFSIYNTVCTKKYGWPALIPEQMVCTMAMAYAMGLPGSLEKCAAAIGISEQKDLEGGRLMLQLSKPRDIKPDGTIMWWEDDERLSRLYKYCIQDVVVERAIGKRILKLSDYERKVWCLDLKINDTGIMIDIPAVEKAVELVSKEKERLNDEMQAITSNAVASCSAVQQIKDYLEFYGISGDSLDKESVTEHLLTTDIDPIAKRILELRAEAGKAATAKFGPMLLSAGKDHRARGCFQYTGANTRRWASRRIQLHNLKRQKTKHEIIFSIIDDIRAGMTAEELQIFYGRPMDILGECVRSFLIASPGNELLVADFNAIEARVLAWLSGEETVLEVFRNGQDVYKIAAAAIFGCKPEEVTDDQRQVGKVAILALGYGGGVGAFQQMAKGCGVKMEPAYSYLWDKATPDQRVKAEEMHKERGKRYEISKEEFIASDLTKIFWREANPNIVNYWSFLESAALLAIQRPGETFTAGDGFDLPPVKYRKMGSFLWCQLPGGGVICYPYPEIKQSDTPWGTTKPSITYMAEDGQTREWKRFSTYGGSLAENITQAVSRDLLADAMLRLDSLNYKIVLHVHDEIVCEMPIGQASLTEMANEMSKVPGWATGLALVAKGFISPRYHK